MDEITHSKKSFHLLTYGILILLLIGVYGFSFYSKSRLIEEKNSNNNNLIISEKTNNNGTKITDIQTEGNLQVTNIISCLNISDLDGTNLNLANYTPADLSKGIQKCIIKEDYYNAAALYFWTIIYGNFDQARVIDKSAHQAIRVLLMNSFGSLDIKIIEKFDIEKNKILSDKTKLDTICYKIKEIGMPKYYPDYMINHGMGAFLGKNQDVLVKDFDAISTWNEVFDNMCNYEKIKVRLEEKE